MQKVIDLYFLAVNVRQTGDTDKLEGLSDEELLIINDIIDYHPTVSGLAYTLGMTTETLRKYTEKDEFTATIKRAKQRLENALEQGLYGKAVTGLIFNLKNNVGWKDQQDVKHSGGFNVNMPNDDADTL